MQLTTIIYPMATLVLLTFFMVVLMLFNRVKAVRARKISPRYYKLYKGGEEPDQLAAITQNFSNLLEIPVLFYTICIFALVLNQEIESFIYYAWAYVILRYLHSWVHATYNHILHRLFVFLMSCFVLIAMWVKVLLIVSATN